MDRLGDAALRYTKGAAMSRGALSANTKKQLKLRYFFAVAATSAAKSVTSFSMPSPSANRM